MKAVIMAGGEGSRLRPLTILRPKPMIPLVNRPLLEHVLMLLKRHGILDVVITLQYLPDRIKDYYGDGASLGMNIQYTVEEVPLGTAGSVRLALPFLDDEPFLVLAGDALTDFNLQAIIAAHHAKEALVTIALAHVNDPGDFGVVETAEDGRILRFIEKPSWSEVVSDTVNTGIYVVEPSVIERVPENEQYDFAHDLFHGMAARNEAIYGHVGHGYWADVGQIAGYMETTGDILHRRVDVGELGTNIGGEIYVAGEYDIAGDAQLYGPIFLGDGVKIKGGVVIHGPSVIRDNVVVDAGAHITRSIVWRNGYIGERCQLRGAILGAQTTLKARVIINDGAVVSDNAVVREDAVVQSDVMIWPDKEIEANATMTSNLIWSSVGRRRLFGPYGITGMVNVELTPEFCARVGQAYGSILPKGSTVMVNREPHNTPRVLKRALLSGLPVVGVNVEDLATRPIPVARFHVHCSDAAGGVHVRLSPYDNKVVDIKFFDERGLDLGTREQRSMERLFYRQDYRRAYLDEMGSIGYMSDVVESYDDAVMKALDKSLWPMGEPYDLVVIDYANASTTVVLPPLLVALKCDAVVLNALLDERRLFRSRADWERDMARLAEITDALPCNFGVRLDVGGERLYFASDSGGVMSDWEALVAVVTLLCQVTPGAVIGVPMHAPNLLERRVADCGGTLRRLSLNPSAQMEAAATGDYDLIGDGNGGFIFPRFSPFFDGMFALLRIMELTKLAQRTLSDVWDARTPYAMVEGTITFSSQHRARMIRRLHEELTADGMSKAWEGMVKVEGEQRLLIWPDPDNSGFQLYAQATTQAEAEALLTDYDAKISRLVREGCTE
ncbi:MAG: NTP transferase domain-containing protein [Anaerolineales bacterium]|nr:NTP transferase domain-containing protein [Anaerolineales bacterium]MCB9126398.1 NTP transferase domain-containing protein [Ardenticatenales bacterium]MCB9171559.1 NTP transferase domain-containing protein [Ardenticatenales bacterium]